MKKQKGSFYMKHRVLRLLVPQLQSTYFSFIASDELLMAALLVLTGAHPFLCLFCTES